MIRLDLHVGVGLTRVSALAAHCAGRRNSQPPQPFRKQ